MPVDKYFKGHGDEVMASMMKKHGKEAGKRMFYATANKKGMTPMSHLPTGVRQTPSGDLGQHRQVEAKILGGFKGIKSVSASSYFKKGS